MAQSVFLCSVFVMVVMSGEVGCLFAWGGMRVGVFVFSVSLLLSLLSVTHGGLLWVSANSVSEH